MKANLLMEAKKLLNQLEPSPPTLVLILQRKDGKVIITSASLQAGHPEDMFFYMCFNDEDQAFFNAYDPTELAEITRKRLIDEKQ